MIKLYSWNVNGIRAVINKGEFQKFMAKYEPDVVCLQETKAHVIKWRLSSRATMNTGTRRPKRAIVARRYLAS